MPSWDNREPIRSLVEYIDVSELTEDVDRLTARAERRERIALVGPTVAAFLGVAVSLLTNVIAQHSSDHHGGLVWVVVEGLALAGVVASLGIAVRVGIGLKKVRRSPVAWDLADEVWSETLALKGTGTGSLGESV